MYKFNCKPDFQLLDEFFVFTDNHELIFTLSYDSTKGILTSDFFLDEEEAIAYKNLKGTKLSEKDNKVIGSEFEERFNNLVKTHSELQNHRDELLFIVVYTYFHQQVYLDYLRRKNKEFETVNQLVNLIDFLRKLERRDNGRFDHSLRIQMIEGSKNYVSLSDPTLLMIIIDTINYKLDNWDEPPLKYGELFQVSLINYFDTVNRDTDSIRDKLKIFKPESESIKRNKLNTDFIFTLRPFIQSLTGKHDILNTKQKKIFFDIMHSLKMVIPNKKNKPTAVISDLIKNYISRLPKA